MNKDIEISWSESTWDCECCGPIYDAALVVTLGDQVIYEGYQSGHFGDGDNLGDPKAVLEAVLKALGYNVTSQEEACLD